MTSRRKLLRLQRKWAQSVQLEPDMRGYLASVESNLRRPFSLSTLVDFQKGSGAELQPGRNRPAKMYALHSSAVLAVNVFDHWVDRDASPLMAALCIESGIDSVSFEAQFPTGLAGTPPNVDVALELASGSVIAIESKFSEWLVPKRKSRTPFKDKYFDGGEERWTRNGLPECQALAGRLMNGGEGFRFLDAPQLLKHALGLATNRRGRFALYYMYYDFAGPASGSAGTPDGGHRYGDGDSCRLARDRVRWLGRSAPSHVHVLSNTPVARLPSVLFTGIIILHVATALRAAMKKPLLAK